MADDREVEVREMTEVETLWHNWSNASTDIPTTGCDCGHDGMGIDWHSYDCRGRHNAALAKVYTLLDLAWNAGLLTLGDTTVDTTPDIDDREELVDLLDMYMRLDDRGDAERVADALIGHPDLLHRLSSRAVAGAAGTPAEPRIIEDGFGNNWSMCARPDCGLEVVRPGKVQCWCDSQDGPQPVGDET